MQKSLAYINDLQSFGEFQSLNFRLDSLNIGQWKLTTEIGIKAYLLWTNFMFQILEYFSMKFSGSWRCQMNYGDESNILELNQPFNNYQR
jgi:hypothetical protein